MTPIIPMLETAIDWIMRWLLVRWPLDLADRVHSKALQYLLLYVFMLSELPAFVIAIGPLLMLVFLKISVSMICSKDDRERKQ